MRFGFLGDLGHVRSFRQGPVANFIDGDKRYLAPEILHDMHAVLFDPPKADVYSLGVVVFEVVCLITIIRSKINFVK